MEINLKHQIYDYYYYENVYSQEQLKELHKIFKENNNSNNDTPAKGVIKTSNLTFTDWGFLRNYMYSIDQHVLRHNQEYIGYNIWPQYDGNDIILNEYNSEQSGEYGWHKDHSNKYICDIKLTVLINASLEEYEGGKFYLFTGNGERHVPELDTPGNMIIFKSDQVHKVTPVTKGKRHSITLFYNGPRWQ